MAAAVCVGIAWIFGEQTIQLTDEQYLHYRSEPQKVISEVLGVRFDEYAEWLRLEGRVQCAAITKAGRRCRCLLAGRAATPREWVSSSGYCATHEQDRGRWPSAPYRPRWQRPAEAEV